MLLRALGRTRSMVSEIGFGALEIGRDWPYWRKECSDFARPREREAVQIVHKALELGINFLDTAPAYVESERLLGIALKGRRQDIVLATKCGEWFDGNASNYNYSYEEVFRFAENSLRNLQTDYIDLLQIHSGKEEVIRRGETMAAMKLLKEQGKVRFLGVSVDSEAAAMAAIESGDYDCIQISYNLLNRAMEARVLPLAMEKNIGIIVKDALNTGRLSGKFTDVSDGILRERIERFVEHAKPFAIPLPEYALRFVLSHQAVSTVIVGTKSIEHLAENAMASEFPERTLAIGMKERGEGSNR